jgi:hypothetical protein
MLIFICISEVPDWTENPEEFITWHRNLLESEQGLIHIDSLKMHYL